MRSHWIVKTSLIVALTTSLAHAQRREPRILQRLPEVAAAEPRESWLTPASFIHAAPTFPSASLERLPAPDQPAAPERLVSLEHHAPSVPLQEAAWGGKPDCENGCIKKCYCPCPAVHRTGIFSEFLYLRSRDSEVAYALPVTGAVPLGPVAIADHDYTSGYRAGFSWAWDECSSLVATFSNFKSSTNDRVNIGPAPAIRALLLHPATTNAAADFLTATAGYDVDFQTADVDYRGLLIGGDYIALNYLIGVRYAYLNQDFRVDYTNAGTTETLVTDVEFDGAGFRLGLDLERHTAHHGIMFYGKAMSSFLVGDFRTNYIHTSTGGGSVANTAWKAGRLVPVLDLELGAGWQSECGTYRLTGGYLVSAWFNTVTTDEWIGAVRANNFVGLNDTMTFDGLTVRAEYRF